MENRARYYDGLQTVSYYSGGHGSEGSYNQIVTEDIELVQVTNGYGGTMRKGPTLFGFNVLKGQGKLFRSYRRETYAGKPQWTDVSGEQYYPLPYSSIYPQLGVDFSLTHDKALASIFDQLRGDPNLAIDVLEGGQTFRMIRNMLSVRKMMKKTVDEVIKPRKRGKRDRSNGQKRLDHLTEKWLEGRYGWLPFVHSTYDILQELDRKVSGGLVTVRGRAGAADRSLVVTGSGSINDPVYRTEINTRFRTELQFQFRRPENKTIYDWTSLNPASIAWELLPWSFVADWFVNVGEVLSLWENYNIYATSFVRGYRTDSLKETLSYSRKGHDLYPQEFVLLGDGTLAPKDQVLELIYELGSDDIRLYKLRTPLTALPQPVSGPRINAKLNANRLLDAASLFAQFAKKWR